MNATAKQKITAASLLVALGIIYGDIGTSPLYVMKAIIGEREITELLVYGGISCVFWTLTFQTTLKYVLLTLSADNHGEGGLVLLGHAGRRKARDVRRRTADLVGIRAAPLQGCVSLGQVLQDGAGPLGLDLVEARAGGTDVGIAGQRLLDQGGQLCIVVGGPPGIQRQRARRRRGGRCSGRRFKSGGQAQIRVPRAGATGEREGGHDGKVARATKHGVQGSADRRC